jgi:hypothetical protein
MNSDRSRRTESIERRRLHYDRLVKKYLPKLGLDYSSLHHFGLLWRSERNRIAVMRSHMKDYVAALGIVAEMLCGYGTTYFQMAERAGSDAEKMWGYVREIVNRQSLEYSF